MHYIWWFVANEIDIYIHIPLAHSYSYYIVPLIFPACKYVRLIDCASEQVSAALSLWFTYGT